MDDQEIRFVEMFAGIGGFRLGLERANELVEATADQNSRPSEQKPKGRGRKRKHATYRCVWANDNDRSACKIYHHRFGYKELEEADIAKVEADQIPDHQLLTARFPCQAFSVAGKRKGFSDTRGTLFYHIARVAEAKRPRLLLLENVKGLLSAQGGYCFKRILETLADLGYLLEWQVLNSKHFGVPQNRERVFVVGHLGGEGGRTIFPIQVGSEAHSKNNRQKRRDRMETASCLRGGARQRYDAETCIVEPFPIRFLNRNQKTFGEVAMTVDPTSSTGVAIYRHPLNYGKKAVYGQDEAYPSLRTIQRSPAPKILHENLSGQVSTHEGETVALRKGASHNYQTVLKDCRIRRLTPVECERLQGFPDGWTKGVSDTQRYKLLGNAVTVNVVAFLGRKLRECLA